MDQRIEFLKKTPFFVDFSEEHLTEMLKASSWSKYEFNEMIIHQDELADKNQRILFVIVIGKIHVMKEGKRIAELKGGDIFGEVSFLKDQPRVADVIAKAKQVIIVGVDRDKLTGIDAQASSCFYKRLAEVILDRYLLQNKGPEDKIRPVNFDSLLPF